MDSKQVHVEPKVIDMRSDTLTLPSREMRETVLTAQLGDDVFGEDPTVNALQEKMASILEKEAALFVPSGTMANLICVLNHCWERGQEAIVGDMSHIYVYEQGGIAQLGGVHPRSIKNLPDGTFSLEELDTLIRGDDPHWPITSLICIENTHNLTGGKVLPLDWVDAVGKKCKAFGIPLHVDGARLFNAAVALNISPARLVRDASSVSVCLSKGLGAPVGSLIVGSNQFIKRAVRLRKVLGGGMRQSGVLAAMGLFALNNATKTIQKDHERLVRIAKGLSERENGLVKIDSTGSLSNTLFLEVNEEVMTQDQFCRRMKECPEEELKALGWPVKVVCKVLPMSKNKVRLIVNCNISDEDVSLALQKILYIAAEVKNKRRDENSIRV